MRVMMVAAVLASLAAVGSGTLHAGDLPDFSGTWVTSGRAFTLLSHVHATGRGWTGILDNLAQTPSYTVVIVQGTTDLRVVFPGAENNLLTQPPYDLSGAPRTYVEDRGDWWRKQTTRAVWTGAALRLTSSHQNGWWRTASPAEVTEQQDQFEQDQMLTLSPDRDELTIETTVVDEKGRAVFRQAFRRGQR